MVTVTARTQDTRFKAGWITLLVIAGLMAFSHFGLMFVMQGETSLFAGYAAFNLYSLVILLIPFRRGEMWAWWVTWTLPVGLAIPAFVDANIAPYYFGAAGVCALALLVTRRAFTSRGQEG